MFNILIVEDDKDLRELFYTVLLENGYHPYVAGNGIEALNILEDTYIDLMISDLMMPEMDGLELTRQLREFKHTLPILMITAKDGIGDKQQGFLAGVDDYMVKPIDVNEMLWRIKALLRRALIASERSFKIGATEFSRDSFTITRDAQVMELPAKEFLLIYKLASFAGKIFTRQQIFDDIWGLDTEADMHTLDVHISRLRERLKSNPDFEIVTVRGLGYKVVKKV